jgi:hypothetical protein
VCVPPNFARQRLSKHVVATTNTYSIEELLDLMFSLWSVSYEILNMQWKHSRQLFLPRTYCVHLDLLIYIVHFVVSQSIHTFLYVVKYQCLNLLIRHSVGPLKS